MAVKRKISMKRSNEADLIDNEDFSSFDVVDDSFLVEKLAEHASILGDRWSTGLPSDSLSNVRTEHICEVCHKIFFTKPNVINPCCPHCGAKLVNEDIRELHVTRERDDEAKETVKRLDRVASKLARRLSMVSSSQDTWTNESREQVSLEMGSDEYEEYVEDLKASDPMKPDDQAHLELEKHNADLVTKLYDKVDNPEYKEDLDAERPDRLKIQHEAMKRSVHWNAVKAAIEAARTTDTLSDDQLAVAITTDNPILYDNGVTMGQYDDRLAEYVKDKP